MNEFDKQVSNINVQQDKEAVNQLIQDYQPFIINTISQLKNEYIQIENDEAYSIGLMAFVEAIEKYDLLKGSFIPFCKLVITSRVKNHIKKEKWYQYMSIDIISDEIHNDKDEINNTNLKDEIFLFEDELKYFGIDFNDLINSSPKHIDTKAKVIEVAKKICSEPDLLDFLFNKKRLPISKIAERFFISVKTIKRYKRYIIAVIIIYQKNLNEIKEWIKLNKKGP